MGEFCARCCKPSSNPVCLYCSDYDPLGGKKWKHRDAVWESIRREMAADDRQARNPIMDRVARI